MYILALEATGPLGSAAVIDGDGRLFQRISKKEMNHLKELMPMASELIDELNISKNQLSAVASSVGPGSFTGIRIGVSSARAICQALQIPAIAVPTLDSFRLKCRDGFVTAVIFNARRGQVYGAVFDGDGGEIMKPGPYMLEDVLELKQVKDNRGNVIFYGDGADAYRDQLEGFVIADENERYQTADMTAQVALGKYKAGETVSVEELVPEYMRETEAEQKLKDGSLQRERAAKLARFKAR